VELSEFLIDLQQDVAARADALGDFTESAFVELTAEYLEETGEIAGFIPCSYLQRGLKVDGYSLNSDEATLDLFVSLFSGEGEIARLNRSELDAAFRRCENFFSRCLTTKFLEALEVSLPVYELAMQINKKAEEIARVRFILLTDQVLSERVKTLPTKTQDGREWSYRVWDLARLEGIMSSGVPEPIEIDFPALFGQPLRSLPAGGDSQLQSYLTVIPGDWLAAIYNEYGGRLLEQNVRTFLQLRGAVNKGIRQTIVQEPEYFFPYNNGISATAELASVTSADGIVEIHALRNFQIVNGGQTTASIFNASKRDKDVDLEKLRVQMKLTVVPPEMVQDLVPKISKFANSQNRISNADFFSNHPFHVRIENISRRVWAPAVGGSQVQTHWFYERARGQYQNAQAYLSKSKKSAFRSKNPRNQVLSKTDLAKYCNTFRLMPSEVSKGAQKNFAKFAEFIDDVWQKGDHDINEIWFKRAVAQAIIFRTTEKLVQNAPWYAKGFRANTVTYSIALLLHKLPKDKALDLKRIWNKQRLESVYENQILAICEIVQARITTSSAKFGVSNVTEWCKKKACWDDIKNCEIDLEPEFLAQLKSFEEFKQETKEGKTDQKIVNEAQAQISVLELGADYWKKVEDWARTERTISPTDRRTLSVASAIPNKLPTSWQCIRLLEIKDNFEKSS